MNRLIVYIPTYNRPDKAAFQLQTLVNAAQRHRLTIVVSDNASTQDYSPVKGLCEQHGIEYRRRLVNIGPNPNIMDGFMFSDRAEYLWILSDDDALKEDGADRVLSLLDGQPDILYLTYHTQETDDSGEWTFSDFLERAIWFSDGAGLISNVIYRSALIRDSIEAGYEAVVTCFPHLAVQMDAFQRHPSVKVRRLGSGAVFQVTHAPPSTPSMAKRNVDTAIAYQRSYFGYLLLAESIRDSSLRREFVKRWATSVTLRHWYRFRRPGFRRLYAMAVLDEYAGPAALNRMKLLPWRLFPFALETFDRLPPFLKELILEIANALRKSG